MVLHHSCITPHRFIFFPLQVGGENLKNILYSVITESSHKVCRKRNILSEIKQVVEVTSLYSHNTRHR